MGSRAMNSLPRAELMLIQRECQRIPSVCRDLSDLEVLGVLERREELGVGSRATNTRII